MEALDKKLFEKNDNLRAEKVMPKLKNSMLSGNSKLNFQLILDQITYELCVQQEINQKIKSVTLENPTENQIFLDKKLTHFWLFSIKKNILARNQIELDDFKLEKDVQTDSQDIRNLWFTKMRSEIDPKIQSFLF